MSGIPADRWGFIAVGDEGEIAGLPRVFAAGDITSFPVKHAGVAAQQADLVAAEIARRFGGGTGGPRRPLVLHALLIHAPQPVYLRAELDARGHATEVRLTRDPPEHDSPIVRRPPGLGRVVA